jgi:precorrin-4/cobalt-precorrin-4 C11-methyltransferase
MPATETLSAFARTKATLAIHLSIHALQSIVEELIPHYGADGAVAVVYRASWPDQRIVSGTLANIVARVAEANLERTALTFVGAVLESENFRESSLYDPDYRRRFRSQPEGAPR